MSLNPLRPFESPRTFKKAFTYHKVLETGFGLQVVAPDTPYVAVAGLNKLYFIDTLFDPESAQHVKEKIENAAIPMSDTHIFIDEIVATAKVNNVVTGETRFVFDPTYARVLFGRVMNRRKPAGSPLLGRVLG